MDINGGASLGQAGEDGREAALSPPPVPRGLVQRPRLLRRLDGAAAGPLTLVTGGAGFGKTSLLVAWAGRPGRRVAWLALEPRDADAATFAAGVAQAVDRVEPRRCRTARALLATPGDPDPEAIGRALANDLAGLAGDLTMVMDDSHHLAAGDAVAVLDALLARPPGRLRLVLAGREEVAIPALARLDFQGQVARIGERALRFTPSEAERLLGRSLERSDDGAAMAALELLDGWPAGLRLLRLRLGDPDTLCIADPQATVAAIGEQLAREVLDREPPELVAFLERIAVLHRVMPELADAMRDGGGTPSREFLRRLASRHLFVALDDPVGEVYQVHALLRGALVSRVEEREGPGALAGLHRRAASWFADRGQVDSAIAHLLEAGDLDAALALVGERGIEALSRDDWRSIRQWMRRVPDDAVGRFPELAILGAHIHMTEGDRTAAAERMDDAARLLEAEPPGPRRHWLASELDAARCTYAASGGDLPAILPAAERLFGDPLARPMARSLAILSWTMAMQASGRGALAGEPLARERALSRTGGDCYHAYTVLAGVPLARGRPDVAAMKAEAEAAAEAARASAAARPHAWALAVVGHCHLEMGDAASAAAAARACHAAGHGEYVLPEIEAGYVLAVSLALAGDRVGARAAAEAVRRLGGPAGRPDARRMAGIIDARLARLLGLPVDPAWVDEALAVAALHPVQFAPQPAAVAASLVLAQDPGRAGEALAAIDACLAVARGQHAGWHVAQALPIRALALDQAGEREAALAALREALEIEPVRMARRFVDLGAPMQRLLEMLRDGVAEEGPVVAPDLRERATRALAAFPASAPDAPERDPAVPLPALADPAGLTRRERQVLAGIARFLTNEEIAAELFLSRETVKEHAGRIYRKLGVSDRRAAARAAAELLGR